MNLNYDFYECNFGDNAKIPENDFSLWAQRAAVVLNSFIFERQLPDSDIARLCLCEIAEKLYTDSLRCGIAREENDGYSVTYEKNQEDSLYDIAKRYLLGSGLLYRGED